MKNILVITYYWPPYSGSGVQRWLKFCKYLPEFGFRPHVYTPENPHYSILDHKLEDEIGEHVQLIKKPIWEPYSIADFISGRKSSNKGLVSSSKSSWKSKILSKIRANYFIPDPRKFWIRPSIKFLKKYIRENDIRHIITTGPPHSMHLIGLGLKTEHPELKWIVDMRDPWSKFDFLKSFGSSEKSLQKQQELESSVTEACDHVIATSYSMPKLMVQFDSRKFTCITNGYDSEDFRNYKADTTSEKIIIYHAGLLNSIRNPQKLWNALERVCQGDVTFAERLQIRLAGIIDDAVLQDIRSHKQLEKRLVIEGYKSHEEVIHDYGQASVLLLLVNNSDNAAANIPGKLFEYIAAGKSILTVSPPGTDAIKILEQYPYHFHMDYEGTETNISEFKSFLLNAPKNQLVDKEFREDYERKNLTSKLVNLLRSI